METQLIRIEPRLIQAVVAATGTKIKARAVRQALEEFLKAQKRKGLKKLAGKLRFYTHADLDRMRRDG